MQPLRQPQRVLLAEQVAGVIEDGIVARRWREWLPSERSFMRVLNVSRQTLRSALARLAVRGRIKVEPRRGHRVVTPGGPSRRLRSEAVRELGLICSEPVYSMPPRMIQVIETLRVLSAEAGWHLESFEGPRFARRAPGRVLSALVRSHPKACWILVMAGRALQEWFVAQRLPAVVYGNVYPGFPLPSAGLNYRACVRHAASYLLARGHRRIVLVAFDLARAGERESIAGFSEAFASHRGEPGEPVTIERPDNNTEALCRQVDRLLRAPRPPTAFVICRTYHYLAVATHLARHGVRVPQDVSLICRGDDAFMQFVQPNPVYYRANMDVIARHLFGLIMQSGRGTGGPAERFQLVPELVPGESVAPCNA